MKALFTALQIITFLELRERVGANGSDSNTGNNVSVYSTETTTDEKLDRTHLERVGPNFHPHYTYSCNEDLSVTFRGVQGIVEYYGTNQTNNCTIERQKGHYGNFHISNECLHKTSDPASINEARIVTIKVFDEVGKDVSSTPISHKILGGYHIFKLTCLPIPTGGVERVALAESGIKDIDELRGNQNEIKQVEMYFKDTEDLHGADVSHVYVGDMFYMYIKYMGSTSYKLLPISCTAYTGTYRTSDDNYISLWSQSETVRDGVYKCVSKEAKQFKVMENFIRNDNQMVHTKLHGFRFTNARADSTDDITVTCKVRICTQITTGGSGECDDKCGLPQIRRRKREAWHSHTSSISKTIKVANLRSSNDASNFSTNFGLTYTALLDINNHVQKVGKSERFIKVIAINDYTRSK